MNAGKTAGMTLDKLPCPVTAYRPFDDLLRQVPDNLGGRRDEPIAQSIDMFQKGIFLNIIEPLAKV